MKKENFYFTFGSKHKHPIKKIAMQDYYVKVSAVNFGKAREIFAKEYGDKFAFQYTDKSMKFDYCPKGCYEAIMQLKED